jgi:hypothetical protein
MNKTKTGHPHAELMLQYAIEAKTNPEPFHEWEFCSSLNNKFTQCSHQPLWDGDSKYRKRKDSLIEEAKKALKEHGLELSIWSWVGVDDDGTAFAYKSKPLFKHNFFFIDVEDKNCNTIQLPVMMHDHKCKLVNVISEEVTLHDTTY